MDHEVRRVGWRPEESGATALAIVVPTSGGGRATAGLPTGRRALHSGGSGSDADSVAGGPDGGDADLPRRAAAGDAAAFDMLFAQHKDRVYGCLYHLLDGDIDVVEDAVGTVFLAAFRALPRFRGDAAFATYLYRIAINEAHRRRALRTRQRQREAPVDWGEGEERDTVSALPGPERRFLQDEEQRLLARAVRALPEPYRTPVILRYLNDLPAVEVARVLQRPAGTVRYQVSRGLDILRERLDAVWPR